LLLVPLLLQAIKLSRAGATADVNERVCAFATHQGALLTCRHCAPLLLLLLLLQVTKLLVGAGADVEIPWKKGICKGLPPLVYAAMCGDIDIIETLVGRHCHCAYRCVVGAGTRCRWQMSGLELDVAVRCRWQQIFA
jgi:hypothetical protein